MIIKTTHISTRLIIILTAIVLLLPSAIKFTHALNHHEHEVCLEKGQTHFHTVDIDCDYYKFKLNTSFYFKINVPQVQKNLNVNVLKLPYYSFLKSHQQLTSQLRGPPFLV
ncbi:hypothetical protein SAMN04515667_2190 [Formosa sp. Hel1_31_208]|uniref:hypothetical protein n=1 Tax=Formosa sp. Hel1_31_208 TaxID=1798225 RepID=UPI00087D7041|nr:hypothetical protein [Formosa sp. Hel1_31_208]SDS44257.1 hypothetical protein SAMN04515667_2190 [Formosa sp. Hel1_31_208]